MDKIQLINLAAKNKELVNYTKKICNYRDIHNDVFQTFLITLFNTNDTVLLDKYNNNLFKQYCFLIIKNINLRRIESNKCVNSKNELSEISNDNNLYNVDILNNEYDLEFDLKVTKLSNFIYENKQCEILLHKNRNIIGIEYNEIIYRKRLAKQLIKKHLK